MKGHEDDRAIAGGVCRCGKLPENAQEQLAALWEETLADNVRWQKLFQRPGSQAFFVELRAEAAQAEQEGTLEDSPDEDWVLV